MYTLKDVVDAVRHDLRDFPRSSTANVIWDGLATRFTLPDIPVVDNSVVMMLTTQASETPSTVGSQYYTVANDTGELLLISTSPTDIPGLAANVLLRWQWMYTRYSEEEIIDLVNRAVRWVGKGIRFKVQQEFSTDLNEWEYDVAGEGYELDRVELRCVDTEAWRPTNRWETQERTEFDPITGVPTVFKSVKFRTHPGIQTMRVHMRTMAQAIFDPASSLDSQPLSATMLPETAFDPMVAYVVWQVLQRTLNFRSRDDAAQHQKQEGVVTMRDLETRVQASKLAFDIVYEQFRDEYTFGRIVS